MKYLNLDIIKKHLNIDDYFKDDDDYLISLGETAEQMVDEHINNCLDDIVYDNNGVLPGPLRHAMLLLVGNLYKNREPDAFTTVTEIPHSYEYLLYPYKSYKNNQS